MGGLVEVFVWINEQKRNRSCFEEASVCPKERPGGPCGQRTTTPRPLRLPLIGAWSCPSHHVLPRLHAGTASLAPFTLLTIIKCPFRRLYTGAWLSALRRCASKLAMRGTRAREQLQGLPFPFTGPLPPPHPTPSTTYSISHCPPTQRPDSRPCAHFIVLHSHLTAVCLQTSTSSRHTSRALKRGRQWKAGSLDCRPMSKSGPISAPWKQLENLDGSCCVATSLRHDSCHVAVKLPRPNTRDRAASSPCHMWLMHMYPQQHARYLISAPML